MKRGGSSGGGGGGSGASADTGEPNPYYNANPTGTHEDSYISYDDDPDAVAEFYSAITGLPENQTRKALEGIQDFTGLSYDSIRQSEFSGNPSNTAKAINEFLRVAPKYKGEVFRGLKFTSEQQLQGFLRAASKGKVMNLGAMSSFSSSNQVADKFSRDDFPVHRVILEVKSNHSGASIKKVSNYSDEDEVLVPRGTKYRVKTVSTKPEGITSITKIQLEEIP